MSKTIGESIFVLKHTIKDSIETIQKVEEWATAGLLTDMGHHKQYCLEQILIALGLDLGELRAKLLKDGYSWEPGIAP